MRLIRAGIALCCFTIWFPAWAGVEQCDTTLIVSTYKSTELSRYSWQMARQVDERTYDQIKREGGVSATIYGIPAGANYSDFQENIKNRSESTSESISTETFRNIAWTGLGSSAADAYKACVMSQSRGIALVPDKATESDITFKISYNPTGGSANPLPVAWFGLESAANRLPDKISAGQTIIIVRRPDKSSTLALNSADASGFSDSVVLTPMPTPDPADKFVSRCVITKTPTPSSVTRGNSFRWFCPERLRAGVYEATLTVVPSAARAVRVNWSANLFVHSDGESSEKFPLATTSGAVIDAGISNTGIGTVFQSVGNRINVTKPGSLIEFSVNIDNTAWHNDFSRPSDDPISFPSDVTISMIRR